MLPIYFLFSIFSLGMPSKAKHNSLNVAHVKISKKTTYELGGTLNYTTSFEGGVARSVDYLEPIPLANFTLSVIRIDKEGTIPFVVSKITSDAKGQFSVQLIPSVYGFADVSDTLVAGQYLPSTIKRGDLAEYFTSSWKISSQSPVDLRNGSLQNIVLTRHDVTSCGICP